MVGITKQNAEEGTGFGLLLAILASINKKLISPGGDSFSKFDGIKLMYLSCLQY